MAAEKPCTHCHQSRIILAGNAISVLRKNNDLTNVALVEQCGSCGLKWTVTLAIVQELSNGR